MNAVPGVLPSARGRRPRSWRDGPFALRDLSLHRALAFSLGVALPLLTLRTSYYGTPMDVSSRIAPVDLICVLIFAILCVRGSPAALTRAGTCYLLALVLSLIPALAIWPGPEVYAWTSFAAALMAFLFYIVGLNLGESRAVLTALLAGVACVTVVEAVIVFHDYFFSSQWFPDPMEGRARGTFKANGQLGAYGFCAAGMLLAMSRVPEAPRLRALCVIAGLLAASFVFTASRRTGMICVGLWAASFLVLGVRFANRRFYRIFLAGLILAIALLAIRWGALSNSFAGKRLTEGLSSLKGSDGFIQIQHRNIIRSMGQWFPLGFGPGRGNLIDLTDPEAHEVHNGLLAVLVEFGVLGFLGFVAMVASPIFRRRRGPRSEDGAIRDLIVRSFLLVCFIFMFHNTLYRDRTFLLFLGMATAVARKEEVRPPPDPEVAS